MKLSSNALRIRYAIRANVFLDQLRESNEDSFHSLNGLIIQLSTSPEIDNESKVLMNFGTGRYTPVYVDEEWWIVYLVEYVEGVEVFSVKSIWTAENPPGSFL